MRTLKAKEKVGGGKAGEGGVREEGFGNRVGVVTNEGEDRSEEGVLSEAGEGEGRAYEDGNHRAGGWYEGGIRKVVDSRMGSADGEDREM